MNFEKQNLHKVKNSLYNSPPGRCSAPQEDVPPFQGAGGRAGRNGQVHPADGHRGRRRLSLQVPQLPLDGGGQGGPGDAQAHVHPPGQPVQGGAVDEQARRFPQTQAHQ